MFSFQYIFCNRQSQNYYILKGVFCLLIAEALLNPQTIWGFSKTKNNKFYVEFIDGDVYSCTVKEINKLKDIILDKTSVAVESNDLVPIFVRIKTKSCVSGQTRPTVTIKNEIIFAALPELLVRYDFDYEHILEIVELLSIQDLLKVLTFEDNVENLL